MHLSKSNAMVIGGLGSGKCALLNEIAACYRAIGARVWMLDVGRSFEKSVQGNERRGARCGRRQRSAARQQEPHIQGEMMMNPSRRSFGVISIAFTSVLTGCANMSGLDAGSTYSCKAPEGVKCDSVSGVYYNAVQNNLPGQRPPMAAAPPAAPAGMLVARAATPAISASTGPTMVQAVASQHSTPPVGSYVPAPLRAAPRVVRLWIKPWEDADRDLNSESLVYVQVDNGRWMVEHVQRQVRDAYAPIRPARMPAVASSGDNAEAPRGNERASALSPLDTNAAVQQALSSLKAQQPAPRPQE